jgi:hypothetical protein
MPPIIIADVAPPAKEGDKPRVEPVGLGAAQHLAPPAAVERRKGKKGARHIQGFWIRLDRRTAEITFPGKGRVVHQPPALTLHQAKQVQEPSPLANAEEFLDIAGVKTIHPFAV